MRSVFLLVSFLFSTIQTPFETVLGVLDLEAECSQFVTDLVTRSPILVALGIEPYSQEQVNRPVESLKFTSFSTLKGRTILFESQP